MKTSFVSFTATLCAFVAPALAATRRSPIKVTMNLITADGVGKSVGTITIKEGKDGVTLEPKLKDLPPGEHGFHVHEKPSCDPADKEGKKTARPGRGRALRSRRRRRRTRGRAAAGTRAICRSWSCPTRARRRTRWRSRA